MSLSLHSYVINEHAKLELVQQCPETSRRLRMEGIDKLVKKWNQHPKKSDMRADRRLWDIKQITNKCITSISDQVLPIPPDTDVPTGFMYIVLEQSFQNSSLLCSTRKELECLFSNLSEYESALNVDGVKITSKDGITFWPDIKNSFILDKLSHRNLEANDCYLPINTTQLITFLEVHQFHGILKMFKYHYDRVVASIYNAQTTTTMSIEELESHINQHSTIQFLKYERNVGLHQHIDNLIRSDATVITIGVGREVVYDISPLLHPEHILKGKILRVTLPEGSAVILNDDVRFHWTHGIPREDDNIKYTMVWKLYHTEQMIENHMETHKFSEMLACTMYSLRFNSII